ncbi:MAG: hypothetical protein AB1332_05985 [Pseudomonadota bacterium]
MHFPLNIKLLLLVGIAALPMLLAQSLLAHAWRDEQLKQAEAQLITHNALAAEHLRMLQEQAKQAIELLAQRDWPIEDRAACTLKAQRNLAVLPDMFANLLVIAPNGQVLCNAKAPDKLHNLCRSRLCAACPAAKRHRHRRADHRPHHGHPSHRPRHPAP